MLESKYNPFIACFLHNCEEYLFSRDYHLLYSVPFGNYEVAEYFDTEKTRSFYKLMDDYINKHGLKIIEKKLILNVVNGIMYIQDCIFTMDNKYYQVPLETEDLKPLRQSWLYNDIEKYEVFPKTVTTTIYVSKND